MANSIKVEVITPSQTFYEGMASMVIVNTVNGEEGFMAGHTWACKLLAPGKLQIRPAGQSEMLLAAVSGGFVDVKEGVTIFLDEAEWPDQIDLEKARADRDEAQRVLREMTGEMWEKEREEARELLARAKTRIKVAESATGTK